MNLERFLCVYVFLKFKISFVIIMKANPYIYQNSYIMEIQCNAYCGIYRTGTLISRYVLVLKVPYRYTALAATLGQ